MLIRCDDHGPQPIPHGDNINSAREMYEGNSGKFYFHGTWYVYGQKTDPSLPCEHTGCEREGRAWFAPEPEGALFAEDDDVRKFQLKPGGETYELLPDYPDNEVNVAFRPGEEYPDRIHEMFGSDPEEVEAQD